MAPFYETQGMDFSFNGGCALPMVETLLLCIAVSWVYWLFTLEATKWDCKVQLWKDVSSANKEGIHIDLNTQLGFFFVLSNKPWGYQWRN